MINEFGARYLKQARAKWRELYNSLPGFKENGSSQFAVSRAQGILECMTRKDRRAFLFVAACMSEYSSHTSAFNEFATTELDREALLEFGVIAFELDTREEGWRRSQLDYFPRFADDQYGVSLRKQIWQRVIETAPDESAAYVRAAGFLISHTSSSTGIASLRTLWASLSSERREAISIGLSPERFEEYPSQAVVWENRPTKLELITQNTEHPVDRPPARRPWIDRAMPRVRPELWAGMSQAFEEFAREAHALGDEVGQVGGLLVHLSNGLRSRKTSVERILEGAGSNAELSVDRYTFNSKTEESVWGPDFVLALSFEDPDHVIFHRYILCQAKVIKNVRNDWKVGIPYGQLKSLLRSSWHSSFHVMWRPGIAPRCVPTSLLSDFIATRAGKMGKGRIAETPTIKWSDLEPLTDPLAALLGDRFLSGEIGDPIEYPSASDASDIARHVAGVFGKPRYGVVVFKARLGSGRRDAPPFSVGSEPIVLDPQDPADSPG